MNYVCSYWLSPDAGTSRIAELRHYFDLQCYLKKRMGSHQTIVTNIDYPGAMAFELPPNFTSKFALFTRYFALRKLISMGLEFPICLHDHDFFNAKTLPHNSDTISVGSMVNGYFSEQAVVYPAISKQAILDFTELLWSLDFNGCRQVSYGTEVRHEGQYSTEQTIVNHDLKPFYSIAMRKAFKIKDQVSFDIVDQHSLDIGDARCAEIPAGTHGVHGHLNKGQASDVLLDWLASNLSP